MSVSRCTPYGKRPSRVKRKFTPLPQKRYHLTWQSQYLTQADRSAPRRWCGPMPYAANNEHAIKKPPFALLFYASSSLLICFLMEHPKGKRRKMQETCRHFDDTSLINPVLTASKRRCGIRRAPLPATLAQDPVASLIAVAFHPIPSRFIPLF